MKPTVSVIVPVYNIEKYLLECLNSLAAQTIENIQVVLVDDGSTDLSGLICKDFIKEHPNFEYHYKNNGGTASARNMGLEYATGEYIGFVDSDDWIEPNMFEVMYTQAASSNADILYCIMPGLCDYEQLAPGTYDESGIHEYLYPLMLPHTVASGTFRTLDWGNCSRLFRSSVIQDNHIRFYEKSRRCEDFAFAVECTLHAKQYTIMDAGELYHYRPNENSKSRSYTKDMWQSIRSLMLYMRNMTEEYDGYVFRDKMDMCVFYFCTSVVKNEARLENKKQRIEKLTEVLNDPITAVAVNNISDNGMNKEYASILCYLKKKDAIGLSRYMEQLAFRKKYIYPLSNRILSNDGIRKLYLWVRRK